MVICHLINIFMLALIIFLMIIVYDYSTKNNRTYTLKALLDLLGGYVFIVILSGLVYGLIWVIIDIAHKSNYLVI